MWLNVACRRTKLDTIINSISFNFAADYFFRRCLHDKQFILSHSTYRISNT